MRSRRNLLRTAAGLATVALGLPATEAEYGVEVTAAGIPRTPPTYAVLLGPVDFETVRADLEGEGTLTELDERGGFRTLRLETTDETRFFGVDGRTGVMAQSRDHFESVVETEIDGRTLLVTATAPTTVIGEIYG